MPATGEDDLEIRLRQDVDTEAAKAAGGLKGLADAFERASSAGGKLGGIKMPPIVSEASRLKQLARDADEAAKAMDKLRAASRAAAGGGGAGFDEAVNRANRIPTALQQPPPAFSAFQKAVGAIERVFGPKAASGFVEGASKVAEASDRLAPIMPALKAGGGFLASGAAALAAAAAAVVVATAAIAYKIGEFIASTAIAETQFKQGAVTALDKLTGGKGAAAFEVSLQLAKDLNIDRDEAVKRVQSLLQLGFKDKQIPIVVETLADFQAVKGEEKANSLRAKLEQIAAKGKINEESIKGLAEAGVSVEGVLGRLQRKGETLQETMARLKANQVGAAEAIAAITAEVESKVGGVARKSGESVSGLANAIKISFLGLFSDIDTGPLKDVLRNVKELLDSDAGKALKAGITEVGNAIFGLLKPFQGEEGKAKLAKLFEQATEAAHAFAEVLGRLNASGGFDILLGSLVLIKDYLNGIKVILDAMAKAWGFWDKITGQAPPVPDTGAAAASAFAAGGDIDRGLAGGIAGNAGAVVDAITGVVGGAISAAKRLLGIASPSKVFAGLGRFTAEGFALGVNDNADQAAGAAANLAGAAIGGAGGAGGAGGSAAGSAGAPVTIIVQVTAGPGTTEAQASAAGDAAGNAAFAAWEANMRRYKRDRGERTAA